MKIKSRVKRIAAVIPGYVWRQGAFNYVPSPECYSVIERGAGTIFIGSPSLPRREYALAWCLYQALQKDYHAKIDWLSFFCKEESEFTGAAAHRQLKDVAAISVKDDLDSPDQLRDLLNTTKLTFVASALDPLALAALLCYPAFAIMAISANDSVSVTV